AGMGRIKWGSGSSATLAAVIRPNPVAGPVRLIAELKLMGRIGVGGHEGYAAVVRGGPEVVIAGGRHNPVADVFIDEVIVNVQPRRLEGGIWARSASKSRGRRLIRPDMSGRRVEYPAGDGCVRVVAVGIAVPFLSQEM